MASGKFEIQVKNGSRWSLHSYASSEPNAVTEARSLLKQRVAEAVKIIKKVGDEEQVVFDEDENSIKKKAGVNFIEDSPVCNSLEDAYKPEAVHTVASLLRDYCDQNAISPTELMHNGRMIEKFCDDPLYNSALERLAALQAVKAGENEKARRDQLFDLVKSAEEKAKRAGFDEIVKGTFNDYINESGVLEDADSHYRVMMSFSNETSRSPSWEGKFAVLFDLMGPDVKVEDLHETTVLFLDEVFAEWLSIPTVIQDVLGHQPDRFNAINVLTKTCIGAYEARKWDTPALTKISEMCAKFPMSKTRAVMADRVENMLRSRSALTKGDMYDEKDAFKKLFPLFIAKNGSILGGEGMAEALTMCATRSFNRDRNLDKPSDAIDFILENLEAPILQLRYLLTLANSQFGKDCADIIVAFIPTFMDGPEHVHDIVHYKLPLKRKLKIITNLQKSALGVQLPKDMNIKLVEWLDDLLYAFLDEERIVDKMDSPDETLFVRTTQMLQFCASGMLIEGRTLTWVRERVQEHLRQPNFVEKFTADVETPKKKELVITQLHSMLKKAGLQQ